MEYTTTKYDAVIGRDFDGNFVVLRYTFMDGEHTGAVGEIVAPISPEEYVEAISAKSLEEYYEDAWREDAGSRNGTVLGLSDWVRYAEFDLIEIRFDRSPVVEEFANIDDGATDIISYGRIFPLTLAEVYRPDLVALIEVLEK